MEPGEYDLIAALEERHWWYAAMRASARALLRHALPAGSPPAHLLDAGCGAGGGLRWLAEFGTATGLDFHPRAVALSGRVSHRVCRASVMAVPFPAGAFDVVTSFDVLYHRAVPDDAIALAEFTRVLRPGGWLLLRVPAHDRLRGAHDVQVHTRRRYARRELADKLRAAGLAVHRLTYAGLALLPPALLRRGLRPGTATTQAHSDVSLPPPLVNTLLGATLNWERWWLRHANLPAGLSLFALARKPPAPPPGGPP